MDMRYLLKYKTIIATFVMALLITVMGSTAEAITINRKVVKDTAVVSIGYEASMTGNGIKINNKKISKMKKKVKAIKTGYYDEYGSYLKTGYYQEDIAYKAGKCKGDGYRYYKADSYSFRFLKAGTYKLSYVSYSNYYNYSSVYRMVETRSEKVNGQTQYYYKLQKITENQDGGTEYKDVGTEEYLRKTVYSYEDPSYYTNYSYYEGVKSKKIYASGSYGITSAKFKKGADGKKHLYYDAIVVKTTTVQPYKVIKESRSVTSVQLGKSKYSYKDGRSAYSTNGTITIKKFLSGKSGKVTVKTGDNYALQSIVVMTYDKDGKAQYQLVNNKGKVTYGAYQNQNSYKSEITTYGYTSTSMYKPTTVYVFYKNKNTGEYTKIKNITKNQYGTYQITYEVCYWGGSKSEYTSSSLPGSNYSSYTFYKK